MALHQTWFATHYLKLNDNIFTTVRLVKGLGVTPHLKDVWKKYQKYSVGKRHEIWVGAMDAPASAERLEDAIVIGNQFLEISQIPEPLQVYDIRGGTGIDLVKELEKYYGNDPAWQGFSSRVILVFFLKLQYLDRDLPESCFDIPLPFVWDPLHNWRRWRRPEIFL